MAKRLKYTKDILTHMLGGHTTRRSGRTTGRGERRVASKSKGKYSNFNSKPIIYNFLDSNLAKSQKGLNFKTNDLLKNELNTNILKTAKLFERQSKKKKK